MALTIVNEQYPPRKPKLTLTADSLDELPTEGVAEGSTATVGGTEYVYENNSGWIEPGSGGGGSDFFIIQTDPETGKTVATAAEIYDAYQANKALIIPGEFKVLFDEAEPSPGDYEYRLIIQRINSPNEQSDTILGMSLLQYAVPVSEAEETGFDLGNAAYEWYWSIAITPVTD